MLNDEIKRVETLYNVYNRIDHNNSNSIDSIRAFDEWYCESLVLFDKFYDDNDRFYFEFSTTNLAGLNGFDKHGVFNNLSGTFKVLVDRIKRRVTIVDKRIIDKKKVFIVHGHDEVAKLEVARLVDGIGLESIILNEQIDNGQTLIEKLVSNSDVGYAIVLYTPCDHVDNLYRARQNVVFEHGYFVGHLGRDRISVLRKDKVEIPTDIDGIVYKDMDAGGGWKQNLVRELDAAGYNVDYSKIK